MFNFVLQLIIVLFLLPLAAALLSLTWCGIVYLVFELIDIVYKSFCCNIDKLFGVDEYKL